jgi:uncharacterized protein with HEPN domain
MKKDDLVYIRHMADSLKKILAYTAGMDKKSFLSNSLVQDGVIRQFEIIGEAVKHLSDEFREKHPAVPWKRMAGLRDKLIHDYVGVDLEAVWAAVEQNVADLERAFNRILRK